MINNESETQKNTAIFYGRFHQDVDQREIKSTYLPFRDMDNTSGESRQKKREVMFHLRLLTTRNFPPKQKAVARVRYNGRIFMLHTPYRVVHIIKNIYAY